MDQSAKEEKNPAVEQQAKSNPLQDHLDEMQETVRRLRQRRAVTSVHAILREFLEVEAKGMESLASNTQISGLDSKNPQGTQGN